MTEETNQAPASTDEAPVAPKTGLNLEDLKVVCGAIEIGACLLYTSPSPRD